jgi:hypothetical protein
MKRKGLFLSFLLLFLLASSVQAMGSANYAIDWMIPLTSGGGGAATSAHYSVNYSIGQTSIGASQSTSYNLYLGFWQNFSEYLRNLLPLISK